jgi:hypothetical protein
MKFEPPEIVKEAENLLLKNTIERYSPTFILFGRPANPVPQLAFSLSKLKMSDSGLRSLSDEAPRSLYIL